MQGYNCPRCNGKLTYLPLYLKWYCYTCSAYPFEENVSYTHQGQTKCPVCGQFLTYVSSYKAWFCYHCQKYSAVADQHHSLARCTSCSSHLTYNAQYGKWYCHMCRKYFEPEKLDRNIETKKTAGKTVIEDVFLIYNDGRLIRHYTRRLKPTVDTDILSGMLVAVQEFVRDAFRSDDGSGLDEITVGKTRIYIRRGEHISLALLIEGEDVEDVSSRVSEIIREIESEHGALLERWDGRVSILQPVSAHVEKLFA